jgi:1-pyrroline-5-carboxylate dehydrogenase
MFENEFTWGKAVAKNETEKFHSDFDNAVNQVKKELGKTYPIIINGKEISSEKRFTVSSPADRTIKIAEFPSGTNDDALKAISSAKNAFEKWSNTPYQKRADIFKDCANTFSNQKFRLAAIMAFENGKNRFEAMGDLDEAIDFMRFYSYQLEKNEGFCKTTPHPDPHEKTQTVMKPFGVWGIIAPFNFPSAIAIGMTSGALLTGNTAVLKPASDTPLSSYEFVKLIYSKLPAGTINFLTGSGSVIGKTIIENPDVDGIAFTGSREVGMSGFHEFTKSTTKPFISEMGGKNPVIVSKSADLEKAANGVMKAAFGFGGQKCSACSRVYVQKEVSEEFERKLVEKTRNLKIGLPWERDVFLGPIINESAKKKFEDASKLANQDGKILTGGNTLQDSQYANGIYVEPTIVSGLPNDHKLVKEELFLPFLCIQEYDDFDDAISKANDVEYGLTAGIFSENKEQQEKFFNKIQAGVVYLNREASATTAALVSSQPFVGWKNSGSTGKGAGGENYLQQFMRTQTQTRCD